MKKKIGIGILVFLILAILIGMGIGIYKYKEMEKAIKENQIPDFGITVSNDRYLIVQYNGMSEEGVKQQEVTEIYTINEDDICINCRKVKKNSETATKNLAKEEYDMIQAPPRGRMFLNEKYKDGVLTYNSNMFNGKTKQEIYDYMNNAKGFNDLKITEF